MFKCNECSEIFNEWEEDSCPRCGSGDITEDIYPKDIDGCDNCPLYKKDCSGGFTSSGNGVPIEPPCTSWTDDMLIYSGMYN
ncbi:hypothetical protein [Tissierella pigra]|uniref:Uncharacterized protein n=1 Tax=Tissierella pigra TaxID=2607614 RepID=A0A6N7XNB6_9FIRM|nr:hypothetical protein [Tissierella pigra]MSU03549.1 hypothetical protein [Tissierella pigra]